MWTDFGEAIVNGIHLPGTNAHEMLNYLLHDWRKSPLQGLDKLIPVLFQNSFDPQNTVNRNKKSSLVLMNSVRNCHWSNRNKELYIDKV